MTATVIVNPAAARGTCGKTWPGIEAKLRAALGEIDIAMTTRPG